MGQRKKELIALKNAGLRKSGRPANLDAKVVQVAPETSRKVNKNPLYIIYPTNLLEVKGEK